MIKKRIINFVVLLFLAINAQAAIRYVTQNGAGTQDGSSWANASSDLQAMINASEYGSGDTIFVATGTYKPIRRADEYQGNEISPNDRENAFVIRKSIYIFGSFAGTETSLKERQLPALGNYTSILSGDLNGNDGANFSNMTDNVYHVLIILDRNTSRNVRVDGFTISGGNANGGLGVNEVTIIGGSFQIVRNSGGGIICNYMFNPDSFTLTNLKITGNSATISGGGLIGGSIVDNVIISKNRTTGIPYGNTGFGGGISTDAYGASTTLNNVVISENTSDYGGGLSGSFVLNNVSIINNTAKYDAGGARIGAYDFSWNNVIVSGNKTLYNDGKGGGLYIFGEDAKYEANPDIIKRKYATFTNILVSGNTGGGKGGGIYISDCKPTFTNLTVSGNTASFGGGIYNAYYPGTLSNGVIIESVAKPEIRNSIIWGNTSDNVYNDGNSAAVYNYSLVQGEALTANGIILNSDPLFVGSGDYSLQAESPTIDKGNNAYLADFPKDLAGNPRINNGTVDLGAYEFQQNNTFDESISADTARTPVAFYNMIGVKLSAEPETGIYIILYDDGTTEKRMK